MQEAIVKKHYGRKRRYEGNQFTNREGNPMSKKMINNDAPVRQVLFQKKI